MLLRSLLPGISDRTTVIQSFARCDRCFLANRTTLLIKSHSYLANRAAIPTKSHSYLANRATLLIKSHSYLANRATLPTKSHSYLANRTTPLIKSHSYLANPATQSEAKESRTESKLNAEEEANSTQHRELFACDSLIICVRRRLSSYLCSPVVC